MSPIRAAARSLRSRWRGSLLTRVTVTTLTLSLIVMSALGLILLSRITTGLLETAERNALTEATAGMTDAQRLSSAVETGTAGTSPTRLVDTLVASLATRAGSPPQFEVLLLAEQTGESSTPERGTNLVSVASVPNDLRDAIAESGRQSWTYTEIRYLDGRSSPGIAVGAPLTIPSVGSYQLYYLFPLSQEASTLDLVRSGVIATAALLVVLLAVIAWLVTRQVVDPVRSAARVAEQFSHGHLEQRVEVRGEDDLARLATSFNDMAASLESQIHRLEELSAVQQRFVADVSHELRTPLTTIRMAADVLFQGRENYDAATARSAELLQTQLDRFESLLVDLLEISRHDAGVAVLEVDAVDLVRLVTRVVEATQPLADRYGSPVTVTLEPQMGDFTVTADARRIDRVMRNLLDNAIEHGEGAPIDIRLGSSPAAVAITVRDHGIGLSPVDAARVFDRFWRADPARARTTGGTGLGLAIAAEDVRLHGGWLEAWGASGDGANFRLTLPRDADQTLDSSPLALVPEGNEDEPLESAEESPQASPTPTGVIG